MMTVSVIQSTKYQIALILVSWLGLHYLSKMIPHILINVLLQELSDIKTYYSEQFQERRKNVSGDFNYSRRLLHTHACFCQ